MELSKEFCEKFEKLLTILEKLLSARAEPEEEAEDRRTRDGRGTLLQKMVRESNDVQELTRRNASAREIHNHFTRTIQDAIAEEDEGRAYGDKVNELGRKLRNGEKPCRPSLLRTAASDSTAQLGNDFEEAVNRAGAEMRARHYGD